MKKLMLLSCFFLISASAVNRNSNDAGNILKIKNTFIVKNESIEYYRKEIKRAFSLLKKKRKFIDLELPETDKVQILSIAFPEILRFDSYSDYLETSSNKILYVNKGKEASDFSTGYFQMKPSFMENLENYVAHTEDLKAYEWILIQKKNEREERKERIKRLGNFQWQLRYLKVFWFASEYKFQNMEFKNQQDKIRFYATAYNYGFTRPDNEITKYQLAKKFSPGENANAPKFAFADFSIDFIQNYSLYFN